MPAAKGAATGAGSADGPSSSADASGGGGGSATASTAEERRAAIAKRLDDSLGTFDQTIHTEQGRVAKERDSRAAAGAGSSSGGAAEGSATTEGPGGRGGDLKSDKASGGKGADGKKSGDAGNASGSAGPSGGTGATAKGLPDGSDDDIVARRLRKAAEQETDPELKEKLWKEYMDYKKNAHSK